ncbi:MAG: copper resistance protein CopC [Methylococcales bacterium]
MKQLNVIIVTVLTASLMMVVCTQALAEGVLMKAQPRDNSVVSAFDGKVKLWFSGNVSDRSPSLIVVDANGNRVDNSDMQLDIDDRSELSASTKPLSPGNYVIRYRVVTEDGLVVSGLSRFTVKP